ncbi:uncharacterized protein V1516DRAFT_680538 [Lipomyces oligophaga]|uniref:uncharacterized protein n=1 Tax=Lipomyces oligophaga TaxID=45792 RepID=UPI0034CDD929
MAPAYRTTSTISTSSASGARKPVANQITKEEAYDYVLRLAYIEYVYTAKQTFVSGVFSAINQNPKSTRIEVLGDNYVKYIRKNVKEYLQSTSYSDKNIRTAFQEFSDSLESKPDFKAKLKSGITLDELHRAWLPAQLRNVPLDDMNKINLAFVDYLNYCLSLKPQNRSIYPQFTSFIERAPTAFRSTVQIPLVVAIGKVFDRPSEQVAQDVLSLKQRFSPSQLLSSYVRDLGERAKLINSAEVESQFSSIQVYETWKGAEIKQMNQFIAYASNIKQSVGPSANNNVSYPIIPRDCEGFYNFILLCAFRSELSIREGEIKSSEVYKNPANPDREFLNMMPQSVINLLQVVKLYWHLQKSTQEIALVVLAKDMYLNGELSLPGMAQVLKRFARIRPDIKEPWTLNDKRKYKFALEKIYDAIMGSIEQSIKQALFSKVRVRILQQLAFLQLYVCNDPEFAYPEEYSQELIARCRKSVMDVVFNMIVNTADKVKQNQSFDTVWNFFSDLLDEDGEIYKGVANAESIYNFPDQYLNVDIKVWSSRLNIPLWVKTSYVWNASVIARIFLKPFHESIRGMEIGIEHVKIMHTYLSTLKSEYDSLNISSEVLPTLQFYLDSLKKEYGDEKLLEHAFPDPRKFPIEIEAELIIYVIKWLRSQPVQAKVITMTETIIKSEHENNSSLAMKDPENGKRYSTSVFDLCDMYFQHLQLIKQLNWQNLRHLAEMYNLIITNIVRSIRTYLNHIRTEFIHDMNAVDRQSIQISVNACIRLNNIEFLKDSLQSLATSVNTEKFTKVLETNRKKSDKTRRYLFSIEIVQGENLRPCDINGLSDPYVELAIQQESRVIARTRTIYKDLNPTWNESFEYVATGNTHLVARVWDEDRSGRDDCGSCTLNLNPNDYKRVPVKDEWHDLKSSNHQEPHGQIRVIVSMEEEKDTLEFYIGRAFKELNEIEEFMIRSITDQFQPRVKGVISLKTLTKVVPSTGLLDRLKITDTSKGQSREKLAEEEFSPLFDDLNTNLSTLVTSLSSTLLHAVLLSNYDSILRSMEFLVLPPLSHRPTSQKPLSLERLDVLILWMNVDCRELFENDNVGLKSEELTGSEHYKIILLAREYYPLEASELATIFLRVVQTNHQRIKETQVPVFTNQLGRAKSVMGHRNLETIKTEKKNLEKAQTLEDQENVLLRLVRMKDYTLLNSLLELRKKVKDSAAAVPPSPGAIGPVPLMFNRRLNMPNYP